MDPTPKRNLVKERQILKDLDRSHPEENYGWEIRGREQTTRDDQTSPPPTTTTTTRTTLTVLGPDGFAAGKNKQGYQKTYWPNQELATKINAAVTLSHQSILA